MMGIEVKRDNVPDAKIIHQREGKKGCRKPTIERGFGGPCFRGAEMCSKLPVLSITWEPGRNADPSPTTDCPMEIFNKVPYSNDIEHLFVYLFAIHMSSLEKVSVQVFSPFLK